MWVGCEKEGPKTTPSKATPSDPATSESSGEDGSERVGAKVDAERSGSDEAPGDARANGGRPGGATGDERSGRSPREPFDILTASVIPVDRDLSKAADKARKAVYKLTRTEGGSGSVSLPQTDYQKVKKLSKRSFRVTVIRPRRDKLPKVTLPHKDPKGELREYLRPTLTLQSNAPLIRKLARKAVGKTKDAMTAAVRLERFVDARINLKGYSVPAATALDAAKMRKGDCSEHAYLLAAAARAVGLPSRVASGALFAPRFQQKSNIFVYHMWTEIRIGDEWVPFDATRPEQAGSVTHILLATDPMTSMLPVRGTMILLRLLGQLDIEVESVTY